eukprot:gene19406-65557_t
MVRRAAVRARRGIDDELKWVREKWGAQLGGDAGDGSPTPWGEVVASAEDDDVLDAIMAQAPHPYLRGAVGAASAAALRRQLSRRLTSHPDVNSCEQM